MRVTYSPPEDFSDDAKRYLADFVKELNKDNSLTKLDSGILSLLGNVYNTFTNAQKILLEAGPIIFSEEGAALRPHPAVKICHDSEIKLIKLLIEFGMTPLRRQKAGKDKPNKDDLSPIEKLIQTNREVR